MQTAAKHTPGPWVAHDPTDETKEVGAEPSGWVNIMHGDECIGSAYCRDYETNKANAKFFAASLEMYDALKAMFKVYGNTCSSTLAAQVAAVLSKIEG